MGKPKGLNLSVEIQCEVRDKNGKLIKIHKQIAESLLKNFALALRGLMYGHTQNRSVTLKGTNGVTWSYPHLYGVAQPILDVNAPEGNDDYGIQIGKDDTPVTRDDWKLASKLSHGSGENKFQYGAMTVEAVDGTPPDSQFRLIRVFTNVHTETQMVKEIGLVFYHFRYEIPNAVYCMIARDVLTTPQEVPSMATLTVRYILKVTA